MLRRWAVLLAFLVLAVSSVTLTVIGPRVLGHATNLIIEGLQGGGIDFSAIIPWLKQ